MSCSPGSSWYSFVAWRSPWRRRRRCERGAHSRAACSSPRRSGSAPRSRRTTPGSRNHRRNWKRTAVNAGSEPVLATQSFLLDQLLGKLEDERPGITDLYFVGFAPYGAQDVFRKDVEAAQHVMDERWGTAGRSIVLVNNPKTLLSAPFATVTNLREALNEIGGAIDVDNDVVMLYLASHGSRDHRLAATQPPLSLVELT